MSPGIIIYNSEFPWDKYHLNTKYSSSIVFVAVHNSDLRECNILRSMSSLQFSGMLHNLRAFRISYELFNCNQLCFSILNVLDSLISVYVWHFFNIFNFFFCSEALPFFLLLIDLSKASALARFALRSTSPVSFFSLIYWLYLYWQEYNIVVK